MAQLLVEPNMHLDEIQTLVVISHDSISKTAKNLSQLIRSPQLIVTFPRPRAYFQLLLVIFPGRKVPGLSNFFRIPIRQKLHPT